MDDYKKPYFILWGGINEAIEAIREQNFGVAAEVLIRAQQEAEDAYIEEIEGNESAVIIKRDFRLVP